ncbi:neuroglian-like protein, partial [Leptotrombidium deliense]
MKKLKLTILLFLNFVSGINTTFLPQPPLFVKQPVFEKLFEVAVDEESFKPFAIECETSSTPNPVYRWLKNGSPLNIDSLNRIVMQPGKGTIVFTKPNNEDVGFYQCIAENEFGTSTTNVVNVRKTFLSKFEDEFPQIIDAIEGESLSIDCDRPDGYPRPELFWVILSK